MTFWSRADECVRHSRTVIGHNPKGDGAVESHSCAQNAQEWGTREAELRSAWTGEAPVPTRTYSPYFSFSLRVISSRS